MGGCKSVKLVLSSRQNFQQQQQQQLDSAESYTVGGAREKK